MEPESGQFGGSHVAHSEGPKYEHLNPTLSAFEVNSMHFSGTPPGARKSHFDHHFNQLNQRGLKYSPLPYSRPSSPAMSLLKFDTSDIPLSGLGDQSRSVKDEYERYSTPPISSLMTMEPAVASPQTSHASSPYIAHSSADALSNLASAAVIQEQLPNSRAHTGRQPAIQLLHSDMLPASSYPVEPFVGPSFSHPSQGQLPTPVSFEPNNNISLEQASNFHAHRFQNFLPELKLQGHNLDQDLGNIPHRPPHSRAEPRNSQRSHVVPKKPGPIRAVFNKTARSSSMQGQAENIRMCPSCRCTHSPCWRPSWSQAAGQLCNSCGLRYKKTGVRCLSDFCNNVPTKGEFVAMLRVARQDSSTQVALACLKCGGSIEVRGES